jgi:hypothetical protein
MARKLDNPAADENEIGHGQSLSELRLGAFENALTIGL